MVRRFVRNRTWPQIASGWHRPFPVAAAPRKALLARSTLALRSPDPWPAHRPLPVARLNLFAVRWPALAASTSSEPPRARIPLAAHPLAHDESLLLNAALARPRRSTAQPTP